MTCVKTVLEESVDRGVASLNSTVRQMLASYWSDSLFWPLIGQYRSMRGPHRSGSGEKPGLSSQLQASLHGIIINIFDMFDIIFRTGFQLQESDL